MNRMRRSNGSRGGLLVALVVTALPVWAGVTNSVPWSDPVEYAAGILLQATNGWSSARTGAGWVTNTPSVLLALTNTYAGSYAYPPALAATSHTAVAEVADLLDNDVRSATGGVVIMDFLALPVPGDMEPPGEANLQYAFYVKTNQHIVVWQHSPSPATNTWLELAQAGAIATGVWTRFTITQNYTNNLYQIQVNGGAALNDPAGYQADGVTPNGPWFHMVQTNGVLSRVTVGDGGTNYVDDFVVAKRSLAWSSGFRESITNDGSVDSGSPVNVTLLYDTFTGANGDFSGYVQVDSGMPDGLSLSALRTSPTNVSLSLTGRATAHNASNSVSNLSVHFTSGAFALSNAADVVNDRDSGLSVTFRDTAILTYSTNVVQENNPANDGSINNTSPVTITLTNDTFAGSAGENFATNAAKLTISGLPTGLTGEVVRIDDTHLQVTLLGNAASNAVADNTSFTLTFLGAAFLSNTVNGTVSNTTANVQIQFVDARTLTYGTNAFVEMPANDGSVTGATVMLQYDTFAGINGDDLAAAGHVVAPALPGGLVLQAFRTSPTVVSLAFSNRAAAHAASDSRLGNVTIAFQDGAFSLGGAATVAGASRGDLSIVFHDPPVLSMPAGLVFTESSRNNGALGNVLPIVLAGDTFANAVTSQYAVVNVPDGLVPQLTRDSDTQVTLSLTGQALQHAAAQTTYALQLVFSNAAFSTVAASNVSGTVTNFTVTFADPPQLAYSANTFTELSYGTIDNRTPMTITLSGDSFTAAPGGDFSSWVSVTNLPAGLSAVFTRDSATKLTVTLAGRTTANASSDSVHNLGFRFLQGAFTADANQVVNYDRNDLNVVFVDDTAFVNTVPYRESFEGYADGLLLAGTNAWTADYYGDAAEVTNGAALMALLAEYQGGGGTYPITTNHTKALRLRDSVRDEIHSGAGTLVYLDFMVIPAPLQDLPGSDTNLQFAFYVNTNRQLVIWHRNTTSGSPSNEWLVLSNNAPLISTNAWSRFTVAEDYRSMMFQVQVNEAPPLADPAGWDASGLVRTGAWFHMVQTNTDHMSRFMIDGVGMAFVDDLTVVSALPSGFGRGLGSVYLIR